MNGFYKGLTGSKSNWLGKTFSASKSTGINSFKENREVVQKYPFKTYEENGKLILDYNLKENPWWIRRIVDELIEKKPNKFEGIMKIKIIGSVLIPVGKFKLEKSLTK